MSQLNHQQYSGYEVLPKATPRPYQSKIIQDVTQRIAQIIKSKAYEARSLSGTTPIYPKLTSSLIEAATGSGKTSTIGFTLEQLWSRKNKLNTRLSIEKQFPNLNILVLNDRIGLVEQLRNELIHGSVDEDKKIIKQPIFSDEFIDHLAIKTYHSKADNDEVYKYTGSSEIEVDTETPKEASEYMHFATLQTAKTDAARTLIDQPNIIIVDEADIISMGTNYAYGEYMDTLMSYYVPDEQGNYPLILAMTATPDNITKDIFGEPSSRFPLAEYLASERGPQVQMYIETPPVADETLIPSILADIQYAKTITDYDLKKQTIAEIGQRIDSLFPERTTPEQKQAYLERAVLSICDKIDDGDRSMIFAESISDANYITDRINEIKGSTIAVARHSENPESVTTTMQNLKNGTMSVVVSVGQLIRGIDVPSVDKIFSLVDTTSAKKYIQLFGRGMRGKAVQFYDYGCSIENLARAGDIYMEYKQYKEQNKLPIGGPKSEPEEGGGDLDLYINDLEYDQSDSHQVNLLRLLDQYQEAEGELLLTPELIKEYFSKIGYDALINYKQSDIPSISIFGNKIIMIAKIIGFSPPTGSNIQITSGFREFISWLFDREYKQLTLQLVKEHFSNIGYNTLINYKKSDITSIEILGNKITTIAKISGFTSPTGLSIFSADGFKEFISWLFDR